MATAPFKTSLKTAELPASSANEKERLADRLQSLLNGLPAGVVVLDGQGRVQERNPAAQALLGEPLLGALWREVIERTVDFNVAGSDIALRNGRLVNLSTCPLGSEPGQILLLQDVTENRRLQAHLGQHQRLADLGRMAASLAHQIRTPLSSALLYASNLKSGSLPEDKRKRFSEKVVASLRNLERLVNDMLIFSRGGVSGEETVAVDELLEETLASLEEHLTASATHCQVIDEIPGAVVRGNRSILASALQNLIMNAVQATGSGGRIELVVQPAPANGIDIKVCDNGPGIPPEMLATIFEPFVTTRTQGTGLGLAVVRAVARAHGGEAWAESKPGEGSCLVVRLPTVSVVSKAPLATAVGA